MIQVNLLPPEKRPPEGTSPARLTVIILGVLFPVLGLLLDFRYWSKTQEAIKETERQLKTNEELGTKIAEQKKKTDEIKAIENKTQAIKDLRQNRLLWGRFHYRFYQMMTALDQIKEDRGNIVVRRFSMKKESGGKYTIDLGVEELGDKFENMSVLNSTFMRTVDRYTGADFLKDPRVVDLAIKLQGINPAPNLKPEDKKDPSPAAIQRKEHDSVVAQAKAQADKLKAEAVKDWTKQEMDKPNAKKPQVDDLVKSMISDAQELVDINNFTGVVFDRILFKRLEKNTGSVIPNPPEGQKITFPQPNALKVDFQLSFEPGTIASIKGKKKPGR